MPEWYLVPVTPEQALNLTRGADRDFIRDHPGQSYLVHRSEKTRGDEWTDHA